MKNRKKIKIMAICLLVMSMTAATACAMSTVPAEETVAETIAEETATEAAIEEVAVEETADQGEQALVPRRLPLNRVVQNTYMGNVDSIIHNDSYSSDVTSTVVPLGIDTEVSLELDNQGQNATPNAFFDNNGNTIATFQGGISIKDLSTDEAKVLGSFIPMQAEGENYFVQTSYAFVDEKNRIVAPTSHGHIIILETTDDTSEILPVFHKVMDVDIVSAAKDVLGTETDTNLLSIIYDYQGNLWFTTGGFRIDPSRYAPGFLGYLSREYIDAACNGESVNAADHLYFKKLTEGEGCENGISSNPSGAVILTNKTCYMLNAQDEVEVTWQYDYESNGANDATGEYAGGGLAWGSGTTPTLTTELVLFTNNMDPVELIALSSETGEEVARTPVLEKLPEGTPVSVENSIIVYAGDEERTSVLVCNWFGAGSAGLADPDSDSSVQTYEALYSPEWTAQGGIMIAPGIERVDVVKQGSEYSVEKKWFRDDIRDTAMIKLSTATGYLYGYWQDLETTMWGFQILDFETGDTLKTYEVSSLPEYNNMAVGMIADKSGNNLLCPTNHQELTRIQDRFVYLPETPAARLDLDETTREALSDEEFAERSGSTQTAASYLSGALLPNQAGPITVAFKINGLEGTASDLTLYTAAADGKLKAMDAQEWLLYDADGNVQDDKAELAPETVYEVHFKVTDQSDMDLDTAEKEIRVKMILGR